MTASRRGLYRLFLEGGAWDPKALKPIISAIEAASASRSGSWGSIVVGLGEEIDVELFLWLEKIDGSFCLFLLVIGEPVW
jgi:hypothetical protein